MVKRNLATIGIIAALTLTACGSEKQATTRLPLTELKGAVNAAAQRATEVGICPSEFKIEEVEVSFSGIDELGDSQAFIAENGEPEKLKIGDMRSLEQAYVTAGHEISHLCSLRKREIDLNIPTLGRGRLTETRGLILIFESGAFNNEKTAFFNIEEGKAHIAEVILLGNPKPTEDYLANFPERKHSYELLKALLDKYNLTLFNVSFREFSSQIFGRDLNQSDVNTLVTAFSGDVSVQEALILIDMARNSGY